MDAFLIGGIIGLVSAIVGAVIDYRILKQPEEQANRLPGCIFLVSGGLGLLGVVVIAFSFFAATVRRSLIAGGGVLTGFFLGFLLMMLAWFVLDRRNGGT